jgi:cbb3-type cytochrome oxidase subunit 3
VTRFSDLVSALSPTTYTELALVLFALVFVAIAIRHGGKRRAAEHAACAQLPFDDEPVPPEALPLEERSAS